MDQNLYIFYFIISLVFLLLSILYEGSIQDKGMFSTIAFIGFLALLMQSLNIEQWVYNATTSTFTPHRETDYYLPMGIAFVLSILSFFNAFINFTAKTWNQLLYPRHR